MDGAGPSPTPAPVTPANPVAILFDADALLQLLIADRMPLLRAFKKHFDIQPGIVEAVEVEIRKSRKFRARFTKELQKAIDSGTIAILDVSSMSSFVQTDPRSTYDAIQIKGFELSKVLDYGEAYTYAAGLVLRAPVVSNDASAIQAAKNAGLNLPNHLLRLFDFLVLCYHIEEIDHNDCDHIRKVLRSENEWLPAAFVNASFSDGLANFFPRLLEASRLPIGPSSPLSVLDVRLEIHIRRP